MKRSIIFLMVIITSCAAAQSNGGFEKNLSDYIRFRAAHNRYSGVTAVFQKEKQIFQQVEGLANQIWDIPNQYNTKFNLASVTKMFTATGIGMLLDEGKIALDETIFQYFPDFPNKTIAQQVTVRQLLSHTSGLSDFFFESAYLESDKNRLRNLEDYDRFYATLRLGQVPENQILYSNSNYVILGRLIEKITGLSYYEFMDRAVFQKAGMQNTGFFESDIPVKNLAEGYFIDPQASTEFGIPNDGRLRNNRAIKAVRGMPAGGAFSTAEDLHRFIDSLIKGKLLSSETFQLMTTEVQGGYAMGFQSYEHRGRKVIGHSGGFYGVSTMVFYLPDDGYTFISLTNTDFGAQPVFDRFADLLNGFKPFSPVTMEAAAIKSFEGHYEVYEGMMQGRQIKVEALEDRLKFDQNLDFFPIGENSFFDIDNDHFTLTFIKDAQGEVIEFERKDDIGFLQKARKIDPSEVKSVQALQVPDELLEEYLGSYQFQEGGMMAGHQPNIKVDNGGLLIDNAMLFKPFERDKFFLIDDIGMKLIFQRNSQGDIEGIKVMRENEVVGELKKLDQ
ncbi:serine hydrolase domain-containing protein [Roseivirga sp.]|uniref:serine hydrolase domain-containing protein n=1 Tax=Roseivirga sp. TaxID=1964215 RepID=UPI003B52D2F6